MLPVGTIREEKEASLSYFQPHGPTKPIGLRRDMKR